MILTAVKGAKPQHHRKKSLWRSLWLLALLAHAPATIKVFSAAFAAESGASDWSSLLPLALANLFILCEISFASLLHVLRDRRSIIAFLLVVALLHVGVIDHVAPGLLGAEEVRFWLALTAGAVVIRRLILSLLVVASWRDFSVGRAMQRALCRRWYGLAAESDISAPRPTQGWLCAPLRAPPHFSL